MTRCKCAVFGCPSASYKTKCKDLNFHFFPNKPDLRKIWVNACKNKKISQMSKKSLVICSLHFKETDYTTVTIKKKNGTSNAVKILRHSIPTLNLPSAISIIKQSRALNHDGKEINQKQNIPYKKKLRSMKSHYAENKSSPEEKATVKKEEEAMSLGNIIYQLIKEKYTADNDSEQLCEEFSSYGSRSKPEPNPTVFNRDDLISAKGFGLDDSEEKDTNKNESDSEIDYESEVVEGTQMNTIETVDTLDSVSYPPDNKMKTDYVLFQEKVTIKNEPDSEIDIEPDVLRGTQLNTIEKVEIHDSVSQPPNKKMKTEPNPGDNSTLTYERENELVYEDDCSTFAAHLKARMRLFDPQQKCIAQKLISDIMFMVEMKQLHLTSEIVYRQPTP